VGNTYNALESDPGRSLSIHKKAMILVHPYASDFVKEDSEMH